MLCPSFPLPPPREDELACIYCRYANIQTLGMTGAATAVCAANEKPNAISAAQSRDFTAGICFFIYPSNQSLKLE